jgi:alpha-methylacyl-CoA racemase
MGPLAGIRILEVAGIGAAPHAAMMLADMGAEVIRIDRTMPSGLGLDIETRYDLLLRGRRSIAIDLKAPQGRDAVLRLVARADALLESFRPGVMERLGLGPDVCLERNPKLVYARLTGWGQDGPYAAMAGHDINYIALAGVLHAIGPRDGAPVPPINLVGDFAGGGAYTAFGMVCALLHAARTGVGQVIDGAMVDGAASLMTMKAGLAAAGLWSDRRGDNVIDGGAPFYSVYQSDDGKYIALGAIEPKFYDQLLAKLGLAADPEMYPQLDKARWPAQRRKIAAVVAQRTRDDWCRLLEGSDVCFAPVLSMQEALAHPHINARGTWIEIDGLAQPAPAPRFSKTVPDTPQPPRPPGADSRAILSEWGFTAEEIDALCWVGAVVQA